MRKGSKRKSFPEGKDCSGEPGRLTGNKKEEGFDAPKLSLVLFWS
ncbi:hypothetical protein LEP1GSC199_0431 [Leptospira vanthielii serovar Holland str. Waz Holland = ATCC 700522]|uniref:Uncharacterized protein n=1 Tax=Leptospira vanthielii serovar Holland str. Waz Holland = ATCC 700522 TaxID=1218591 RepID=N1WB57_9LEPT|nr:hypothetical protein LEP1GSC199_0431 [Leptospira vanthielii serovar Holland str. Waz Holland = ATCC 700522]